MNYLSECLARFQALPVSVKDIFGGPEIYLAIKEIENKYKVQLSFLLILIVLGELEDDDIEDYLNAKFKTSADISKKVKEEFLEVFREAFDRLEDVQLKNSKFNSNPLIEKEDLINLFSKRLIESIKSDADTIFSLNISIFKTFNKNHELGEKIVNILYNNSELVGDKKIVFEGKELSPTISNWIKDFIRINGSDIFSELVLAQYLSTSPNPKDLNEADKFILRKVLKLYRNLVFYPESMDGYAVEDWQIIPYERTEIKTHEFIDALGDSADDQRDVVKISENKVFKDENIDLPKKEEVNPLQELQRSLDNYNPASLEYKALLQEINRLNNKK